MPDTEQRLKNLQILMDFVLNAPSDEEIMAMDCNDSCTRMASLAERVADGESLDAVLPELKEYMKYWGDCREEFIALVKILKAELADDLPDLP